MKATEEQIRAWKEQYGAIYQLESEGKTAYVYDPVNSLPKMKILLQAMLKGGFEYVDAFLAQCWIDGDPEVKTDDSIKTGLIDQVMELVDIPASTIDFVGGFADIQIEDRSFRVRMATRLDLKYAEDRNRSNKPLDTQIYLLDRIAVDAEALKEWREDNRLYMALLLAVNQVKDRKYVSIKKL